MPVADTVHFNRVPRQPVYAYSCVAGAISTDANDLLRELDTLLTLENHNGLTLQATFDAHRIATGYLTKAADYYVLPPPDFTPDGEGGIDIEWENAGRHLAINFSADGSG